MTDTDPRTDGIDSHPDPTTGRLGPAVTPLTAGFGHPPSPGHPPDPGDPPDSALLDPGYPRNSGLPELFEARAAAAPLAPAARHRDRVMTYGQLSDGSDRLAARLLAAGVEPGSAVGVCGSRSLEALVAFLGILKAGCAYVPLDEDHPPARLRAMAEDAGVHVAVVLPGSTRRIRGLHTRVELGRVTDAAPPDAADGTPLPVAAATDRAYVMFTSGSTGRPKPVAIAHRGVAQLVLSDPQLPPPGPGDGVLHGYGLSSDASTIEIWSGLLGGACLVLVDREELLAPAALEERFRTHGVTVAYLTTSVFHHLARTRPGALSGLRFASAGGEAMDPGLARAVQTACPGTTLVNFYGPTENSVVSTAYVLPKLTGDETRVPIGRPFATSTCHVLRPDGTPAAPDEEGELYVGGDGLALEYIGDAELTAERFVSLPVDPGGRLYRTGDRAVRGPDGLLEYRGRLDRQVKVRGQRIELDEVEARLRSHAEVGEAVVELRDGVLAAYLTPARPGGTLPVDALRRYCVRWLPAQAVPTLIARDRFPVTSGGKVDRKRLLAESRHDEVSAPRGETREGAPYGSGPGRETRSGPGAEADGPLEALAEVWQLVLRVRPAPTDNFFLIGGDSLLAAEVVARTLALLNLDAALGSGLIRALLSDPTLEGFAAAVGAHLRRPAGLRQAGTAPGAPEAAVDFVRETALGFPLPPARTPLPQPGDPSDILLTGASGFVGAFLLDRLLRDTTARIHCPVRASGAAHAERRVLAALTRYGLRADDAARQRLVCFPADLAAPGLGLSPEHADGLAACLDLIVHNGAQVNFLYPYSALRAANVEGTREIIGLAAPAGCRCTSCPRWRSSPASAPPVRVRSTRTYGWTTRTGSRWGTPRASGSPRACCATRRSRDFRSPSTDRTRSPGTGCTAPATRRPRSARCSRPSRRRGSLPTSRCRWTSYRSIMSRSPSYISPPGTARRTGCTTSPIRARPCCVTYWTGCARPGARCACCRTGSGWASWYVMSHAIPPARPRPSCPSVWTGRTRATSRSRRCIWTASSPAEPP